MKLRACIAVIVCTAAAFFATASNAQTLFAATGSNGVNGNLFTVNPATAASTLVGAILVAGNPVSITGLAVHPTTGVIYAIVSNNSPNNPNTLITINPATAVGTLVGAMGVAGSDISFNSAGTLFVFLQQATNRLGTINIATGAATALGASGLAAFNSGGGMAINGAGPAFVSTQTSNGTLDSINTATGVGTAGPVMNGGASPQAMDAMAFSSGGVLFAVNTNRSGSPTTNSLVTINTATGAVTTIGALPGDTDAIAFATPLAPVVAGSIPTLSQWALVALALLLGLFATASIRRRN
jgi:IPTL-CTERM motif